MKFLKLYCLILFCIKLTAAVEENTYCLYQSWFNATKQPANTFIAPDDKWREIICSLTGWVAQNKNTLGANGHQSIKYKFLYDSEFVTEEQIAESRKSFLNVVEFVDIRNVIRQIPGIIQLVFRSEGTELSEKSQTLLSQIFSDSGISVYFKSDLARVLVMLHELYFNPNENFMYADLSINPHNISELFTSYTKELNKFGIVMANSSIKDLTCGTKCEMRKEKFTVNLSVAPPGFENSAFIAKNKSILFESFVFGVLRPFISDSIIEKIRLSKAVDVSQQVFSMHQIAFLYSILCNENEMLYLDGKEKEKFKKARHEEFFGIEEGRLTKISWPKSVDVIFRKVMKNAAGTFEVVPNQPAKRSVLGAFLPLSMVMETCLEHTVCTAVDATQSSVTKEVRLDVILTTFAKCRTWPAIATSRRAYARILESLGADAKLYPDLILPVMKHHFLVTRHSRFIAEEAAEVDAMSSLKPRQKK